MVPICEKTESHGSPSPKASLLSFWGRTPQKARSIPTAQHLSLHDALPIWFQSVRKQSVTGARRQKLVCCRSGVGPLKKLDRYRQHSTPLHPIRQNNGSNL